jgi:hypothetical protein
LVIVEGMSYLVHDEITVFEVAKQPIIDFYTDVIFIFLETETAEEEILHPMVANFSYNCFLSFFISTISSFWMILPSYNQHDQKHGKELRTYMKMLRASSSRSCYFRIRP